MDRDPPGRAEGRERQALSLSVGDEAPDFVLRDQHHQKVRLSDFRGIKNVVLMFYPFAFTPVCQSELATLRDHLPSYQNESVQVLTVSVDSVFAHRVWAEQEGFEFPLLADYWPHGEVARAYGVLDEKSGAALRGSFIIDKAGVIRWLVINAIPDARDHEEYLKVLASL